MRIGDPPAGSGIRVSSELDGLRLAWKKPSGGASRFAIAAFLILWLSMWAVGLVAAGGSLLKGDGPPAFLVVWLSMWVIGGGFAVGLLYLLLRPQAPESVRLGTQSLSYDTGSALPPIMMNPFYFASRRPTVNLLSQLFRRRRVYEFSRADCPDFVLEGQGVGQRLRFDVGADRVEVGETLREPEREWLAQVIEAWKEA